MYKIPKKHRKYSRQYTWKVVGDPIQSVEWVYTLKPEGVLLKRAIGKQNRKKVARILNTEPTRSNRK
jgi:hypothetical protein